MFLRCFQAIDGLKARSCAASDSPNTLDLDFFLVPVTLSVALYLPALVSLSFFLAVLEI